MGMAPDLHDVDHGEPDDDEALLEAAVAQVGELALDYQDPEDLAALAEGDPSVESLVRILYLKPSMAAHLVEAGLTDYETVSWWVSISNTYGIVDLYDVPDWHEAFSDPLTAAWAIAHGATDLEEAVALARTVGDPPEGWDIGHPLPDPEDELDDPVADGSDDPPGDGPHPWS